MQTIIPSDLNALKSLLTADFTAQWRNRRSVVLLLLVPVIILISWKGLVDKLGGAFVLSNCITIGLNAIGLMGYSNAIARDRDKGIFQRLRVAPVSARNIMISRLLVQLAMILLVTMAVFIAGYYADGIAISAAGYAVALLMSIAGGALYLGLGQAIVGLIKNPESVNAATRLVYFIFIMVGMFGELGMLGDQIGKIVKWSPYGVVRHIVSTGLEPATWSSDTTISLLLTIGYAIVFAAVGIKKFKWSSSR
jgi:ABC-2 type transport system permease protein